MLAALLCPLLVLGAPTVTYPAPGRCSGDCNVHDPAIILAGGVYYRFSTGNRISIATAPDFAGPWKNQGSVLPSGSSIDLPGNQDLWAPDVSLVGDTYYLYYSVSEFGSQASAIGLATSTSLGVNSWTDHGSVGITSTAGKDFNAIDANLVQLANGDYQLNFGSFWGDLLAAPAASPPVTADLPSSHYISFDPAGTHAEEGGFMVLHWKYYYLFYSWGICCNYDVNRPPQGQEYQIKVCRSQSSTEGFVDRNGVSCNEGGGTTVLASHDNVYGPGGVGVYHDPKYGDILYYHYVDPTIGFADEQKRFGYNKIYWQEDWPTI